MRLPNRIANCRGARTGVCANLSEDPLVVVAGPADESVSIQLL